MISVFHDPIGNTRIGNHPRVSAPMSGIFSKRPPQPKYPFTWDVETVFDFIRKLPGNYLLSDKLLTLKVSILLALLSASRVSEMTNLTVDHLTKHSSVYTFAIPHLTKTCQRGKKSHSNLKFYNFAGDNILCVCKVIDFYLNKPTSPSTVYWWLGQVLAMASINTGIFKAYLARSTPS